MHIKSNFTSLVNKERQILTVDSDDIIVLQWSKIKQMKKGSPRDVKEIDSKITIQPFLSIINQPDTLHVVDIIVGNGRGFITEKQYKHSFICSISKNGNFNIVCITETWLSKKILNKEVAIKYFVNNHHICCADRANSLAFYKENGEKKKTNFERKILNKI